MFKKYVPEAQTEKQALIYDIQGRPTLHFDPFCELSITDAIDDLYHMETYDLYKYDSTSKLVLVMSSEFFAFAGVFQIIMTLCYLKSGCRRPCVKKSTFTKFCCCCCLKGDCCYKLTKIIHGATICVFATLTAVWQTTNYSRQHQKYIDLERWQGYRSCVDYYMHVTDEQYNTITYLKKAISINFGLTIAILSVSVFSLVSFFIFAAKHSREKRKQ